jgi:hypothetical protein
LKIIVKQTDIDLQNPGIISLMTQSDVYRALEQIVERYQPILEAAAAGVLFGQELGVIQGRAIAQIQGRPLDRGAKSSLENNMASSAVRDCLQPFADQDTLGFRYVEQAWEIVHSGWTLRLNKTNGKGMPRPNRTARSRRRLSSPPGQWDLFDPSQQEPTLPDTDGSGRRQPLTLGWTLRADGTVDKLLLSHTGRSNCCIGLNHLVEPSVLAMMGPAREAVEEVAARVAAGA